MRTRLLHIWEVINAGYWFVPTLMLLLAALLALGMLTVDRRWSAAVTEVRWFYAGGVEGTRTLLATVAGSIITVAGVVFSITVATLAQASNQYGPRLLRNFMRDTRNQLTLGTFSATFLYCLLVLRSVSGGEGGFVPHAAVTVAMALAVLSIVVLVYFIHHVSQSLLPPLIVAAVAGDLQEAIRTLFPSEVGHGGPAPRREDAGAAAEPLSVDQDRAEGPGFLVRAPTDGYLQAIDQAGLLQLARRRDLLLRVQVRPGDYIMRDGPLLLAYPPERCGPDLQDAVDELFIIGRQRTAEQDIEFALSQIAEIGVRALSPGINDPYTAMTCIDRLGSSLLLIARHDLHRSYRYDDAGRLRVIVRILSFEHFVRAAFDDLRHFSREIPSVQVRLLQVLAAVASQLRLEEQLAPLRDQVEAIGSQCRAGAMGADAQRLIARRYAEAVAALEGRAPAEIASPGAGAVRPTVKS